MFAENLDAFLADFGVPVDFPGAPVGTLGLAEFADLAALGVDGRAAVIGRQRTLLLKTSVADLLHVDDAITVNGAETVVLDRLALGDGAFTLLEVR